MSGRPHSRKREGTRPQRALAWRVALVLATCAFAPAPAPAQVILTGRVWSDRLRGIGTGGPAADEAPSASPSAAPDRVPLGNIRCFASLPGPGAQALGFRTWEQEPAGWFRMAGAAGAYSLLFTGPGLCMRPLFRSDIRAAAGDTVDVSAVARFDYAVIDFQGYDRAPARGYVQTFTAAGTALTQVAFWLAHDGVDGAGPGGQRLLVSVHREGPGTPDTWVQVGPTMPVPGVDSGGPKNYQWTAGWNSGEVPLVPGAVYAVRLRAEAEGGVFQAFWHPDGDARADCYRIARDGTGAFAGADLAMLIAADGDGLVIPYNKRVQREYGEFAGFDRKWAQTYVARGRGLAAAVLYAATGGSQPGIDRQRATVRVREGGPTGRIVGVRKVAIGNGIHTGDASWGTFGMVFAPGEVPLTPGATYAIEFETAETPESLRGYVNIKGVPSDERPGFNPYRKHPLEPYAAGTAYRGEAGAPQEFDLDMQLIEYERDPSLYTHGSGSVSGSRGTCSPRPVPPVRP